MPCRVCSSAPDEGLAIPEGDTIYRAAVNLRRAIEGERVVGGLQRVRDETVAAVESRGKHLLIWFEPSGLVLHSHMMMTGSWHLYRPGQRWRRSSARARAVVETGPWIAVCFDAPVCDLLTAAQAARRPALAGLGPDALDDAVDLDEARKRLEAMPHVEIGQALLDQRVLAGVGNVYRCEVLHIHGVDPWAMVGELERDTLAALLTTSVGLLKHNAREVRRVTTGSRSQPLHVYGRAGRPCRRCATPIRTARQGEHARVTFWCPGCQRPGSSGAARPG